MNIRIENLSFRYGKMVALRDVTWSLDGGVIGLLGPNGSGKTTLLSLLVTLLAPKVGSVRIGDHDLGTANGRAKARALLGFVPQRFSLVPEMRVKSTVAYAGWVNGLPDKECDTAADRALALAGLADKVDSRVRSLSGGQRQRVGFAAGLVHDPAILVLDEPTVGLDPGQRLRTRELIASIGEQRTVVISSHLLEDISHLCQRVGILSAGRLVFDGDVAALSAMIEDARSTEHRLGSSFEQAYDMLISKLDSGE